MILMSVVYLGAYLTGAVDAETAKKALSPEAKALLEAHTNGGVWMVYGSLAVMFFKIVSIAVKKIPARIVFLVVLGLFFWGATGVVQKGCALTYKHGVNVATKGAAQKAQTPAAPAATPSADENKTAQPAAAPATIAPKEKVEKAVEATKKKTEDATKAAAQKATEATEAAKEKVAEVTEAVKEKAAEATEAIKEKVTETIEKAKETVKEATQPAHETPAQPTEPTQIPVPVETPPAG
jgi:flagellar biosynthesis GTPase FlhF